MSPTFKTTKKLTDDYSYSSSHVSLNQEDRDQNERPCTSVFDKLNFADGTRQMLCMKVISKYLAVTKAAEVKIKKGQN